VCEEKKRERERESKRDIVNVHMAEKDIKEKQITQSNYSSKCKLFSCKPSPPPPPPFIPPHMYE